MTAQRRREANIPKAQQILRFSYFVGVLLAAVILYATDAESWVLVAALVGLTAVAMSVQRLLPRPPDVPDQHPTPPGYGLPIVGLWFGIGAAIRLADADGWSDKIAPIASIVCGLGLVALWVRDEHRYRVFYGSQNDPANSKYT